jgi:hypothetical protein
MNIFLQFTLAIIVVVALFAAAFAVYSSELIKEAQTKHTPKQRIDIFKGIKDLKTSNNEVYNTSDDKSPTYKNLELSINRLGGAEFTYNFWLYKPNPPTTTASDLVSTPEDKFMDDTDIVLLLRGSKRKTAFYNVCNVMGKVADAANKRPDTRNILVKCPLIKLQRNTTIANGDMDVLAVELNTQMRPDGVRELSRDMCNPGELGTWAKFNQHKLAVTGLNAQNFVEKWFMVTVVIRDTNPIDRLPIRNKIVVQIYINGVLELERYVDNGIGQLTSDQASILRQNFGPLHVAPFDINGADKPTAVRGASGQSIYMADLSYHNYALSPDEIALLYSAGYTKTVAPSIGDNPNNRDILAATYENKSVTDGKAQLVGF